MEFATALLTGWNLGLGLDDVLVWSAALLIGGLAFFALARALGALLDSDA